MSVAGIAVSSAGTAGVLFSSISFTYLPSPHECVEYLIKPRFTKYPSQKSIAESMTFCYNCLENLDGEAVLDFYVPHSCGETRESGAEILPDRLMVGLLPLEECILVRIQVRQQNIRSRFYCRKQYAGGILCLGFEKPEQGSHSAEWEARLGWRVGASDGEQTTRQESKSGSQFEIDSDFNTYFGQCII